MHSPELTNIIQGTSTFFTLVEAFCKVLDTLPQDQTFTQLIISQMVTYFDKCCGWYKGAYWIPCKQDIG